MKLAIFTGLVTVTFLVLLEFGGGYADYFYPKVASPKQTSLITGDSRGMYGIRPAIVNERLSGKFDLPIMNYSFTVAQAMYGECYLESIRKKLDPGTGTGLFILTVNPWMFLKRDGDDYANGKFFEAGMPPHNLTSPAVKFNPEHIFKNFEYAHYSTLLSRAGKTHDDGWFEDRNIPSDSASLEKLGKTQIALYEDLGSRFRVADYRLQKFSETVRFLKQHGTVVIVRMPLADEIVKIERRLRPAFDSDMENIALANQAVYLNYTKVPGAFSTFDKVHLDHKGSAVFTERLCDSLYSITKRQ